jgi:hypothetical protein
MFQIILILNYLYIFINCEFIIRIKEINEWDIHKKKADG